MIVTLLITILVEGGASVIYATRRTKPVLPILLTSVFGNLVTQPLLWFLLTLAYRHYLVALVVGEIAVWAIESFLFHAIPFNQLNLKEAALLSLGVNGISLAIGWFLPI